MMVASVSSTPNPKVSAQGPKRPPLLPSEAGNGVVGPRKPKSREITSRYLSSTSSSSTTTTPSTSATSSLSSNSSSSRRCPSPFVSRTVPMTPMPTSSAANKRSQSVDRRRPATPRPTTPTEMSSAAKLLVTSKRSLSVSFQGESFSLPVSKTKPAPTPATNALSSARKGTPERRKATPVKDHRENSKPIDQQRWPGRSREVNSLTRSMDYTAEKKKTSGSGSVVRALQQSMIDESSKPSCTGQYNVNSTNADPNRAVPVNSDTDSGAGSTATSDLVASDSESVSYGRPRGIVVPARFWQETTNRLRRLPEQSSMRKSFSDSPILSPRGMLNNRGLSSPLRGAVRPASPSKLLASVASSPSRGMLSPSRVRNGVTSMLNDSISNASSILSFAADVRRGKIGENRFFDAHMLRLVYNRQLQWRFVNARADAAMLVQKERAEKSLYKASVTTSVLRNSVKSKRVELQVLRQNLKLYSILKGQMLSLDSWDIIDGDHSSSLSEAVEALEASTIRLPVVGGARVDIQNMKEAICSAVDVMHAMASSICALLKKVDQVNLLVSEVANVTKNERALLDHCKDLLSTLTAMQVKDCSLRAHVLQQSQLPLSPDRSAKADVI